MRTVPSATSGGAWARGVGARHVIGKPASTAVVELGLRSHEGFFVRVARSGRADLPRHEPVSAGGVEWLTVSGATGNIHRSFSEPRPPVTAVGGGEAAGHVEPVRVWDIRGTHAFHDGGWMLLDESFRSRWMTFEWAALPTHCGPLDLSVRRAGCDVVVSVRGVEVPPGGIVLRPPIPGRAASVDVNGRPAPFDADGVTIATCPADVVLRG